MRKECDTIKKKKKNVPPKIRKKMWLTYVGDTTEALCFCCKSKTLTTFTGCNPFHAGHILSDKDGGKIELGNLLPICTLCNKKMSSTHWDDFVKTNKLWIRVHGDNIPEVHKQATLLIQRVYRKYRANKIFCELPIKKYRKKKRKRRKKKKHHYLEPTFSSLMKRKKMVF